MAANGGHVLCGWHLPPRASPGGSLPRIAILWVALGTTWRCMIEQRARVSDAAPFRSLQVVNICDRGGEWQPHLSALSSRPSLSPSSPSLTHTHTPVQRLQDTFRSRACVVVTGDSRRGSRRDPRGHAALPVQREDIHLHHLHAALIPARSVPAPATAASQCCGWCSGAGTVSRHRATAERDAGSGAR